MFTYGKGTKIQAVIFPIPRSKNVFCSNYKYILHLYLVLLESVTLKNIENTNLLGVNMPGRNEQSKIYLKKRRVQLLSQTEPLPCSFGA